MAGVNDNLPLTMKRRGASLHSVGSYQVAGTPWLTASAISNNTILTCSFPMVSKTITVYNIGTSNDVRVHFADDGKSGISTANYFSIPATAAGNTLSRFTFDVKCKEFYISADQGAASVEVYAALTGIPTASMMPLYGPGLDA
mgnify:CR=1 FL=1